MNTRFASLRTLGIHQHLGLLPLVFLSFACSSSSGSGSEAASGGSTATTGGAASGGAVGASGGSGSGTGGAGVGGWGTGGAGRGGAGTGGSGTGGSGTGGSGTGGSGVGGSGTGGSGVGGSGVGGSGVGGSGVGGSGVGGSGTGGAGIGGEAAGGATDGGAANGGAAAGGAAAGGAAAGGSTATDGRSAGCDKEPTIPSSQYNNGTTIPITAAGVERRYILAVPENYDNTKAYRLIIAWHQLDGNDKQMYANGYYHLRELSDDSAIFVAPNGVRRDNGQPCTGTGNGESGCGWPNPDDSDMALGDAVVAEIEENFCVDTNRIFATGWSYGGSMSYANACERPLGGVSEGYIRAAAIYSGAVMSPFNGCKPSKPVAYYGSHGTGDNVLGYDGGVTMAQNWATVNGCTWATPTKVTNGNHVCTKLSGCTEGYPVEFCSFNGPHTPDPSDGGGGSWQYQEVWDFFSQF